MLHSNYRIIVDEMNTIKDNLKSMQREKAVAVIELVGVNMRNIALVEEKSTLQVLVRELETNALISSRSRVSTSRGSMRNIWSLIRNGAHVVPDKYRNLYRFIFSKPKSEATLEVSETLFYTDIDFSCGDWTGRSEKVKWLSHFEERVLNIPLQFSPCTSLFISSVNLIFSITGCIFPNTIWYRHTKHLLYFWSKHFTRIPILLKYFSCRL